MRLPLFQIDAFAERVFQGNPAAVCPLEAWLPEALMQAIAAENNLSETAFCVPEGEGYGLRWFTPLKEIDLCGHATLATAHVLFEHLGFAGAEIVFSTRSGALRVTRAGDRLAMDFPAKAVEPCAAPGALIEGLGLKRPRSSRQRRPSRWPSCRYWGPPGDASCCASSSSRP